MRKALLMTLTTFVMANNCSAVFADEQVLPLLTNVRAVSVSASEDEFAAPDRATVLVMIESDGSTFKKSLENNLAKLKKLQDLAATLNFTQSHEYTNLSQESSSFIKMNRTKSYRMFRFVHFYTQSLKSVPELAWKIVDLDDFYLREIHFENSHIELQKNAAFNKAFEKAKTRASYAANQSGQKLGKILRIAENYTEASPKSTPINCDSIKVTAKVDLSFEILD
ncbi:MAG: SIMPL domain-containing protein [Candidatus Melainabacteria bacterium]|nr:SIMPL domain-containing protein [Candidatus Melainabacteria bacterium]